MLAPLLCLDERPGFVVEDMTDVDAFGPIDGVEVPDGPVYAVTGLDRGDEMANWSPDEALPAIVGAGRTPLTLTEGIDWLLQAPDVLARNRCFMTIGSRLRRPDGAAGRAHARDLDQQRHRPGRQGAPRGAEGGLVLGGQPAHLARLRLRRPPRPL